ncbi:abc bile acid transporter [Trichoderma cornu-damae]|uniref:Abc bile acid transporter n=1 Tax=Trichoderma cornu-damae TaxID=654480 RepID=A0A9P8TWD8_9HYPO|nr:abc bile acid transporter [Trichoderma cornu-damae]
MLVTNPTPTCISVCDAVPEKIGLQDLPDVAHDARAQTLVRVFRRVEQRAGNASLWEKLARAFATPLIQQWLLALLKAFSQFAGIFFLHRLLEQLEGPVPYADGRGPWTQVFGLGFALTMETVTTNWLIWVTQMKLEMPVIALLNTLIFEKHMRRPLPHEAEQSPDQTRGGQTRDQQSASPSSLTDMISNDSSNVSQLCDYIHYFLIASFKLLFDVVYLSRSVGITSVLTGAASALVLLPLSARLSKRQQHQQQTLSIAHASVSNLISEALQGLRRIRLSSTERIWQRKIADARERELGRIWKSETTLAFLTLTANLGPILLASVALSVYAFRVGRLSPSVAFASLNLFRSLHEAFSELPLKAAAMSESWVSLQRIQRYLDGPEQTSSATASESIGFEGATLTWARGRNAEPSETTTCFRLRDVNLSFPKGKLSIITGKTGSGKSLLVASMLGEAVVQAGRLRRPVPTASGEKDVPTGVALAGETALVSQPPWIESCTIRDNIVFGYEFDEARYRQVIHACALGPDLSVLPSGDMTEAGVDGAVLSGGQKWRVALARALYSPARILILEDVLSAVDAPVARWIHEHALTGELARGRTRILVTHHPELCLAAASYVVVVEDGAAVGTGKTETRETAETATSNKKTSGKSEMPDQVPQTLEPLGGNPSTSEPAREILRQTVHRTKWQLLSAYVSAAGGARACILCALVAFGYQASSASHTWWLTRWTERQDVEGADVRLRIIVYLILSLGSGAVLVMQSLVFSHIGLAVSRALFGQMVNGILAAPLAWIDATPMGEVLHSLGGDMYEIDHRTSQVVIGILSTTLHLTSILLTNFISAPGTVLPGAFLLGLYSNVASHYFRLSQRLHKLIPASQRPMLEHASSAVTGLLTIRAFGKAKLHAERMRRFTDTDTKVGWHLVLNQRWLGTRLGALGALFVTAAAAAMVFQGAGAAEAGFVMTFALQLRVALGAMIGRLAATDRGFNAIDRMLNLTETPRETEQGQDAPECWPEEGAVRVDNVGVRYGSDLRPALKDISFSLKPRQRLGIVGRTGAGKTSLTSALLRFVDLSEGRILIDGRDIASLKLSALRSAVMLIPQDPFLFSGTLRANLDLGQDKTDAQLWSALRRVRLIPDNDAAEATAFADLSMEIRPGGDNLSHGQRQLVCLARALLARCRVLVLDEATSAVDGATDAAIQQVIRREFAYATILVVAHRLVTVADSDAILVLRDGEAAEFGSPAELMAREGEFWHMVRQSADADKMERMMMTRA